MTIVKNMKNIKNIEIFENITITQK